MSTGISWATETWNPLTGCEYASEGCRGCYAARDAYGRLRGNALYAGLAEKRTPDELPRFTGELRYAGAPGLEPELEHRLQERLSQPARWRRPRLVFVNSQSDLFHPRVPQSFIADVWAVMEQCPRHTFIVLTKRARRMASVLSSHEFRVLVDDRRGSGAGDFSWPLPNVIPAVSAESQQWANARVPWLLQTPAALRMVSAEPLLGPVSLAAVMHYEEDALWRTNVLTREAWCDNSTSASGYVNATDGVPGVGWVIVGGESGSQARPMHPQWARALRDECESAGVAFHFKQWGEWAPGSDDEPRRVGRKAAGRLLDGREHLDVPTLPLPQEATP